jgi:hypothetical protein
MLADLSFPASEPSWIGLAALGACAGLALVLTAAVIVVVVLVARRK